MNSRAIRVLFINWVTFICINSTHQFPRTLDNNLDWWISAEPYFDQGILMRDSISMIDMTWRDSLTKSQEKMYAQFSFSNFQVLKQTFTFSSFACLFSVSCQGICGVYRLSQSWMCSINSAVNASKLFHHKVSSVWRIFLTHTQRCWGRF